MSDPQAHPDLAEQALAFCQASISTGWTPLRCAVAGAANLDIASLLLERGAVPDDHDLYLACFGDDERESLRLLLARARAERERDHRAVRADKHRRHRGGPHAA